MIYWISRFFINHRITAHNRTSHRKSLDDDYGGHSYRAAKTLLYYRVCFGCFVFYGAIHKHRRGPPSSNHFKLNLIGGNSVKKFFKLFFQRGHFLNPLRFIIPFKEGGVCCEKRFNCL